jgi:hypothetical protein
MVRFGWRGIGGRRHIGLLLAMGQAPRLEERLVHAALCEWAGWVRGF